MLIWVCFLFSVSQSGSQSIHRGVEIVNTISRDAPNSIETVINDMTLLNEGLAHGLPDTYVWNLRPRVKAGNNPEGFAALIPCGQLYEDVDKNPAKNTRVQIRDIKAYVLSKRDGKWHPLHNSRSVGGAAYREDWVDDINKPADKRPEEDGSYSVKAGGGYNFHFWGAERMPIDPGDIAGVFTTVQARLVVDDPAQPDDRVEARYVLAMAADYWRDLKVRWDQGKTNSMIGHGRLKYVRTGWQSFNMITLSEEETRRNPPPLE